MLFYLTDNGVQFRLQVVKKKGQNEECPTPARNLLVKRHPAIARPAGKCECHRDEPV